MRAVDCHIHWWPIEYYEFLEQRKSEPRTERDGDQWIIHNGIRTVRTRGTGYSLAPDCFDLDAQLETVAKTGHETTVLCSPSVHSDLDGLPAAEAREAARIFNEAWGAAQRRHRGKFFALAALPLQDTEMAIEELEYAVGKQDLRGVALPGSINGAPIDAPRLEPVYARIEELGLPVFVHPTDGLFAETMNGGDAYGNLIYMSLGRVVDSSVGILRLILSGILDRCPTLKVVHFQAGGVLPYAAGRLDKNASASTLERKPTEYLKSMWVDTALPGALAIKMALEFYGDDRVLYGSDNPCWNPRASLDTLESLDLPADVMQKVMHDNAHSVVNLRAEVLAEAS